MQQTFKISATYSLHDVIDTQLLFTNINVLYRDLFNVISQAIYLLAFLNLRKTLSAQSS